MPVHRVPKSELEQTLQTLARSGERIDTYWPEGDEWVIVTEDRFEIRPGITHADRLGIETRDGAA